MKGSYQNYRQQKQSSKVMRSYIVQAAAKGAYELRNYGWTKDAVLNMSVVRIGPNYVIDVPRIVQCFQMKGENHA